MRNIDPTTLIDNIDTLIKAGQPVAQIRMQLQLLRQKMCAMEESFAQIRRDHEEIAAKLRETRKQLERPPGNPQ